MSASRTFALFPPLPAAPEEQTKKPRLLVSKGRRPPAPQPQASPVSRHLWLALHVPQLETCGERQPLERIALWCHRFTPRISLEPPDGVLLEVRGSLRLFGGARALIQSVVEGLGGQGIAVRCALTPTPRASLWLARAAGGKSPVVGRLQSLPHCLAPLPLVCLRWPEEQIEQLARMGARTIEDLLRLPRSGFARRFGAAALGALDRAVGRVPEPRQGFLAVERYEDAFAPEVEVDNTQWLEVLILMRFGRLQSFLRTRQAALSALKVTLNHRSHPPTRMRIALAAPIMDIEPLQGLLCEHLAKLRLPAPVTAVHLRSAPLLAGAARSASLPLHDLSSAAPQFDDVLPRILERLRARLGAEGIFTACLVEDHRPERAWARAKPIAASEARTPDTQSRTICRDRPLWLLHEPKPLSKPPQLERGPERIETGWWDGQEVARDYFVARNARGARLWVYRERRAPHRWYLHGLFG